MKDTAKYTLRLIGQADPDAAVAAARERMAADPQLAENARLRSGGVKMEKWWSVAAGLALVVSFILYTAYLTIPAVILICLLALFLVYIGISLRLRTRRLARVEHEISPQRSADAVLRHAAGMHSDHRLLSYCDSEGLDAFKASLSDALGRIAASEGIAPVPVGLQTRVDVTTPENIAEDRATMNVYALFTLEGGVTVSVRYSALFAIAPTGDCILADERPTIE